MSKKRVGILFSRHVPSAVDPGSVRDAAIALGCNARLLPMDSLPSLKGYDLLINTLGPAYPESEWLPVLAYYESGGVLLNLGPCAFTQPYVMDGKKPRFLAETDAALHAFSLPDTFVPTGPMLEYGLVECSPRYAFLDQLASSGEFPALKETWSLDVRVATEPARPHDLYSSHGRAEADFEAGCVIRDKAGRPMWAPVVGIGHYEKGSLVFFNGTPLDEGFFASEAGRQFLRGMIEASLSPRFHIEIEPSYSRYKPNEAPVITVSATRLGEKRKARECELTLEVFKSHKSEDASQAKYLKWGREARKKARWKLPRMSEGQYHVRVSLSHQDRELQQASTGFYVCSDRNMAAAARRCPSTRLDPLIAPDFCIRDGRPWPMHGTTYTVTGLYRDCFQKVNVHQCDREMGALKEAGINVLRTGIWTGYERVYNQDGTFKEEALRSLDAYFLTAARYDLPVHFVFAAFVMNHWDRNRDPFHDRDMVRKIHNQFKQFAKRYRGWPNVVVDIINEPSYSPYRDGWMWQIARPMGSASERKAWVEWLRRKYKAISRWREAWGASAAELPDWRSARTPDPAEFVSNYDGVAKYDGRVMIADFMEFATESFNKWVRGIRDIVKKADPKMLVLLGRDETLRVPAQQYEHFTGNIDFTNWHQWHREGTVFLEYVLNRVRGVPNCGQEMGVLIYKDHRNNDRIDEYDCRNLLERKLLYCMGNWVQWQSHNDLTMDNIKEAKLGLYRGDGTERPYMTMVRLLSWVEDQMASHLVGRREDLEDILIVHPTSVYYSSDHPLGYRAAMNAIIALHYHLNRQANLVIEPLFRENNKAQIGDPNLIIVPSPTLLHQETWEYLLRLMREKGKTVLLTGDAELDPCWKHVNRMEDVGLEAKAENIATQEEVRIDGRRYNATFRMAVNLGLPAKALRKPVLPGDSAGAVSITKVGKGKLIYCPVPVELGDDIGLVVDVYRHALANAPVHQPVAEVPAELESPAHFVYPIRYADCTMYTLINEGPAGTIRFRDRISGTAVAVEVAKERGAKVWLGLDGALLGAYLHGKLEVGDTVIDPRGEMAAATRGGELVLFPGERCDSYVKVRDRKIPIRPGEIFDEVSG